MNPYSLQSSVHNLIFIHSPLLSCLSLLHNKKKNQNIKPFLFQFKKSTYQSQLNTVLEINNSVTDDQHTSFCWFLFLAATLNICHALLRINNNVIISYCRPIICTYSSRNCTRMHIKQMYGEIHKRNKKDTNPVSDAS